jgi:hypothetical protein
MNVRLTVQLGIQGRQQPAGTVQLSPRSVGGAAAWAGSYHILFMGRHFDDYVVTQRLLGLPMIPGFPDVHPYQRLTGKIRAAGVTGNIGESVAALVGRRRLGLALTDIAPLQPGRRLRSPDYLMRIKPSMPGLFRPILPSGGAGSWPDWWPVESKARTTEEGARAARLDALRQLVAYWSAVARQHRDAVGFGVVVTLVYHVPREVRATLILPRRPNRLRNYLMGRDVAEIELEAIAECLHE